MANEDDGSERLFQDMELQSPTAEQAETDDDSGKYRLPRWLKAEIKQLWRLSWSMIIISMFSLLMNPVAIVMCGHLGTPALAGVAIATTVIHVTGTSVAIGLCTACDTVFSQTFGSQQKSVIKIHLYRSIIVIMLFAFPCWALQLNTESILLAIGQDPIVSRIAGKYLFYFMPALPAIFLTSILIQYLRCQDQIVAPVLVSALGFLSNTLLHYVTVFMLNLGTDGSAMSLTTSFYVMALTLLVYVMVTERECWVDCSGESFQEWGPFVQLAMGGLLMVVLEWWAYQIGVFVAGLLGEVEIAAASILFQILSVAYIFPLGIGLACNIRVGQLLGSRDILRAKRSVKIAVCLAISASFLANCLILSLKGYIPLLFTSDSAIDAVVERTIPILVVLNVLDGLSGSCVGVLRGCGRQLLGSVVMFGGFFLVGLPIGITLLLTTELEVMGLYLGFLVGVLSHCLTFVIILRRTDWQEQVECARKRTANRAVDASLNQPRVARVDADDELQSLLPDKTESEAFERGFLSKLRQKFDGKGPSKVVIRQDTTQLIIRRGMLIGFMILIFLVGLISRFVILKPETSDLCPSDVTSDEFRLLNDELKRKFSDYCYDFYVKTFL